MLLLPLSALFCLSLVFWYLRLLFEEYFRGQIIMLSSFWLWQLEYLALYFLLV